MNNRGVPYGQWIGANGHPTQGFQKMQADLASGPVVFDSTGRTVPNSRHIHGQATIGAGGSVTVSLISPGVFTDATTYSIFPASLGGKTVTPANVDGTSFTLTGTAGDVINWMALGS